MGRKPLREETKKGSGGHLGREKTSRFTNAGAVPIEKAMKLSTQERGTHGRKIELQERGEAATKEVRNTAETKRRSTTKPGFGLRKPKLLGEWPKAVR